MSWNTEFIRKWVDALRSGKYKQGRNKLCNIPIEGERSFCCLGVACDISGEGEWVQDPYDPYVVKYMEAVYYLPTRMCDLIGSNPISVQSFVDILVRMNDVEKKNFDQIADFLEDQFLKPQISALSS